MRFGYDDYSVRRIDPRHDWRFADPAAIYPPASYDVEPCREQPEVKRERERMGRKTLVAVCVLTVLVCIVVM